MDYNDFKQEIFNLLQEKTGHLKKVTLHSIEKNSGLSLDAVTIMGEKEHVAPTIYLSEFYEWSKKGADLEVIAEKILELNRERGIVEPGISHASFEDYRKARTHICYKLVNFEKNRRLLKNVPHILYLDLAIVFYYRLEEKGFKGASFLIHNCNMDTWGVTVDELLADAGINTCRKLPFTFQGMEELIRDMTGEEEPDAPGKEQMYILTNEEKYFGAAAILYPHVLSHISRILGGSFYVLPSSIHECILVPDSGQYSKTELEDMVKEVNMTQVEAEEVLSDRVYYYDYKKDSLMM